jgi:short-subunit dehydrogenase involved in D-alanine esterification of teichoic acids
VALDNMLIVTGRSKSGHDAAKEKLPSVHPIQSDAGDRRESGLFTAMS